MIVMKVNLTVSRNTLVNKGIDLLKNILYIHV